ncbi:MAG: M48 family metalloprotease [Deltaproteobacteria bacterium]|nr:M48 family metalloprotease [Deltaproteobacteria bacterium]
MASVLQAVPINLEEDLALLRSGQGESLGLTEALCRREAILINVVEEIAVAALIPPPDVYILTNEKNINAMAVGPFNDDGAIIITIGALKYLTRDELQGLIAHEISHLVGGDGVTSANLAGALYALICIHIWGKKYFLSTGGQSGRLGLQTISLGLCLYIMGFLGNLLGLIVQSAYSRQREYLADARAVEFSRSKDNLANVLKKIGGLPRGGRLDSPEVAGLRHFFIAKPDLSILNTHPPLEDRILTLDPSWDGFFYDFVAHPINFLADRPAPLPIAPKEQNKDDPLSPQNISPLIPAVIPYMALMPLTAIAMTPAPPLTLEDQKLAPPRAHEYKKAQKRALELSPKVHEALLKKEALPGPYARQSVESKSPQMREKT